VVDPDTAGFFEGLRARELRVCRCAACDRVIHLPRQHCAACGSWRVTWRAVRPAGSLFSWTVVEHQVHPAFEVPHTVVLVELDDEPTVRLAGRLPGRVALRIGQAMAARFDDIEDDTTLLQWDPVDA
jgi:uncharacterized OB-fold protein